MSVNSFIIVACEKKISRALDKKLDKNLIKKKSYRQSLKLFGDQSAVSAHPTGLKEGVCIVWEVTNDVCLC